MKLLTAALAIALFTRAKMSSVPIGENLYPVERNVDEERILLELPDHVVKIAKGEQGYYTLPSEYPVMFDVIETFRTLMSSKTWFSPAVKHITEEQWVLIINAENPQHRFDEQVRMLELKFNILKIKI